jgi:hypothetical protein
MIKKCVTIYETASLAQPIKKGAEKKMTSEQARQELHKLIESIPAEDLSRFVGAHVAVVC